MLHLLYGSRVLLLLTLVRECNRNQAESKVTVVSLQLKAYVRKSAFASWWTDLLQASVMATGRLCSVAYSVRLSLGCCEAAQRECLMNLFFCLNHEKRKNTDGRFSLWEPWKLIVRKGGVGINVSYTRCYQAYCRKGHQYRFRAQTFFFFF